MLAMARKYKQYNTSTRNNISGTEVFLADTSLVGNLKERAYLEDYM